MPSDTIRHLDCPYYCYSNLVSRQLKYVFEVTSVAMAMQLGESRDQISARVQAVKPATELVILRSGR